MKALCRWVEGVHWLAGVEGGDEGRGMFTRECPLLIGHWQALGGRKRGSFVMIGWKVDDLYMCMYVRVYVVKYT